MSPGTELDQANREKHAAALNSVLAAVFLTGMKAVVGLMTGSLGILAEALHSALDLAAAGMTLLAVRVSGRPAGPRPHLRPRQGREPVGARRDAAAAGHLRLDRLRGRPAAVLQDVSRSRHRLAAFVVMAVSIVVDVSRSRMLMRVAREARQPGPRGRRPALLHRHLVVGGGHRWGWRAWRWPAGSACPWLAARRRRRRARRGGDRRLGQRPARPSDRHGAARRRAGDPRRSSWRPPSACRAWRRCGGSGCGAPGADTFADVVLTVDRHATLGEAHAVASRAEDAARALLPTRRRGGPRRAVRRARRVGDGDHPPRRARPRTRGARYQAAGSHGPARRSTCTWSWTGRRP